MTFATARSFSRTRQLVFAATLSLLCTAPLAAQAENDWDDSSVPLLTWAFYSPDSDLSFRLQEKEALQPTGMTLGEAAKETTWRIESAGELRAAIEDGETASTLTTSTLGAD